MRACPVRPGSSADSCQRTIEQALALEAHMSVTKPIRNREAPVIEPQLE
jgi:hypothetical protein